MVTTADRADEKNPFGFTQGQVIQEIGYDDDVDDNVREQIESIIDDDLVDEDYGDVTDGAIIWWREEDGDLVDTLVDVLSLLDDGGTIWVLTPKSGRPGHVGPGEISEAARTAGLNTTSTVSTAPDWSGTRVVARGRGK